ncbi:MAG: DUF2911 domain-containing protein [Bacteroidota bacterium]
MKKFGTLFTLLLLAVVTSYGQSPKSPRVTSDGKLASVSYGQPSKRGRDIFGTLEPYGKVWRTGANDATEITFKKDVQFGGKPVKAGTYTLFTIPTEKEWTIILNGVTGQFGAFDYDKNKAKDVLSVKVPIHKLTEVVEKLTITPEDNALKIAWDKTSVSIPMK